MPDPLPFARKPPKAKTGSVTMKEEQLGGGTSIRRCIYTPHSLRATTATLLLDANVDIVKVKDLLGHRHITTTQIYDKRRRSTSESASHLLAI